MDKETSNGRRYEIDALRVIALILLILYHIFICYQPFAEKVAMLRYKHLLEDYWVVAELLNIWRIPVLFVISGMALGFVFRRRSIKELVCDRMIRLVPPFVFGCLVITPCYFGLFELYHGRDLRYTPHPGHLWFVLNLVSYTFLLLPLVLWIKKRPNNLLIRILRKTLPVSLFLLLPLPLIIETSVSEAGPQSFAFFPTRYWFGFCCYTIGFLFLCLGDPLWNSLRKTCHLALPLAILLFLCRIGYLDWLPDSSYLWSTPFESSMWMLSFLGYGSLFLNRPIPIFGYLNKAVFPIYILHFPVQQLVAFYLFKGELSGGLTFLLHSLLTFLTCWLLYQFVVRRIRFLHPVMGMKLSPKLLPSKEGEPVSSPLSHRTGRRIVYFVITPVLVIGQLSLLGFASLANNNETHQPDLRPTTDLAIAALNNDTEKLKEFLALNEISFNARHREYELTPLHLASLNGSTECAQILIEAGADINLRSGANDSPLSLAAFMGHHEIVNLLIENKAFLNSVNEYQQTPLDNTDAEWKYSIMVAKMVGLTVDKKTWAAGRKKAKQLLRDAGAKHNYELE